MKKYSVIGYHENNGQRGIFHVTASNEIGAVRAVPVDPDSFVVVAVVAGHVQDEDQTPETAIIADYPEA